MNKYTFYPDGMLDNAYQAAHDKLTNRATLTEGMQEMNLIAAEIVDRLTGVSGGLAAVFSYERFPKYDALRNYVPSRALYQSVAVHASDVGGKIASVVKPGLFLVGAGIFVAAVIYFNKGEGLKSLKGLKGFKFK